MPENPLPAGTLRNLEQYVLENIGGCETAWYVPVRDVLFVPESDDPIVTQTVQLRPGAFWYQIGATQNTLRYQQPSKRDRHGDYYQVKLTGVLARYTGSLVAGLEALQGHRFLILFRDLNGEVWLVGTLDEPLDWAENTDLGNAPIDRNGTAFTLAVDASRRARSYQSSWLVSDKGLHYGFQNNGGVVTIRDNDGTLIGQYPPGTTVILPSDNHEELAGLQGGKENDHWHLTRAEYNQLFTPPFVEPTFGLNIIGTPAPRSTGYYKRGTDTVTNVRVTLAANKNSAGAVVSSLVSIPPAAVQNFVGLMTPNPKDFASALVVSTTIGASATFGPGGGRNTNTTLSAVAYLSFAYSFYYGPTVTGPVDLASLTEVVAPFGNSRAVTFPLKKGERSVLYVPGDQFIRSIVDQNGFPANDNWTQTKVLLTQGRDTNVPYIQLLENDPAAVDNTATFTFNF